MRKSITSMDYGLANADHEIATTKAGTKGVGQVRVPAAGSFPDGAASTETQIASTCTRKTKWRSTSRTSLRSALGLTWRPAGVRSMLEALAPPALNHAGR